MTSDTEIDFRITTLDDLTRSVRAKEVSARELTEAALTRIERLNPVYNAFIALDGDRALDQAAQIDARIAAGADPGPLAGIPIGVKDLQHATGFRTTFGSALYADAPPDTADDPFIARLRAAGCVILGKTNTPEFGWMGNTTNTLFGPSLNPFDTTRGPGGSSGGASAALAAGMVPLATGSDGGGSIRIPSACCGLAGMKPSLGRVPSGGPNPDNCKRWGEPNAPAETITSPRIRTVCGTPPLTKITPTALPSSIRIRVACAFIRIVKFRPLSPRS